MAIDDSSRELAQEFPLESGHIASLGTHLKQLLQKTVFAGNNAAISSPSEFFEICNIIDSDRNFAPNSKIVDAVSTRRKEIQEKLLELFFKRQTADNNEQKVLIRRRHFLVLHIASWLPLFRAKRPKGMIGPAWLKEHCDPDFWEAIQWYIHDGESQKDQWSRFTELLPGDVRNQFDASLTPMEDIRTAIRDEHHALALLTELAKHRGKTVTELTDPVIFADLYETEPVFRKIIEFYRNARE